MEACAKHRNKPVPVVFKCPGCELEHLRSRVAALERFVCHSGGLVNEWAKSCPFGTKLTDHIKNELNDYLKRNP